jgi:hypothetical protein
MEITAQQASGLRLATYFALVVAVLSSINWLSAIHQQYVMEHQWPAVSATIYSRREDSREVTPPSIRQRSYWVYWGELLVILDIPPEQCPGNMVPLTQKQAQCTGTVKSPEAKSRAWAVRWLGRHPVDSRLTVHYDPQSERMWAGGESILDIYPWDKIGLTAILLAVAALMRFLAGMTPSPQEDAPPAGAPGELAQ